MQSIKQLLFPDAQNGPDPCRVIECFAGSIMFYFVWVSIWILSGAKSVATPLRSSWMVPYDNPWSGAWLRGRDAKCMAKAGECHWHGEQARGRLKSAEFLDT